MSLIQKTKIKCLRCFLCSVFLLLLCGNLCADEEKNGEVSPEIHVSADKLVSDRNKKYAEFIGNVVVVRENANLTCNKLKIYYAEKEKGASKEEKASAIEKIIATENVRLTFDDKIAVAEKAVYTSQNDSIVLTGGTPKVTSGNSYVSGDKITLFRTDGKVIVDRGENKRVSATFHPQDEELIKKKKD